MYVYIYKFIFYVAAIVISVIWQRITFVVQT